MRTRVVNIADQRENRMWRRDVSGGLGWVALEYLAGSGLFNLVSLGHPRGHIHHGGLIEGFYHFRLGSEVRQGIQTGVVILMRKVSQ
jgi:hypothetical protein